MALEPGLGHFTGVDVILGQEVGVQVEEALDVAGHLGSYDAAQRPGRHGDNPLSKPTAILRVAGFVDVAGELGVDVPVTAQVYILYSVHGGILQGGQFDLGGKYVQAHQIPVELGAGVIELGHVDEFVEIPPFIHPVRE